MELHNSDYKTKSLSNPNPDTLQPNWPAGLTSDSSASRFQQDVTGMCHGHTPEHQKSAMQMVCFGTRHWISGLRLLATQSHHSVAELLAPCVGSVFDQGVSLFTESHSHQLYLGLLHLLESTSFLFQPVRRKQSTGNVSRHGTDSSSLNCLS